MAASSGIVFAEALLGRDGRVAAQTGAQYAEEARSGEVDRVGGCSLAVTARWVSCGMVAAHQRQC
jgi:hypothetical protein